MQAVAVAVCTIAMYNPVDTKSTDAHMSIETYDSYSEEVLTTTALDAYMHHWSQPP